MPEWHFAPAASRTRRLSCVCLFVYVCCQGLCLVCVLHVCSGVAAMCSGAAAASFALHYFCDMHLLQLHACSRMQAAERLVVRSLYFSDVSLIYIYIYIYMYLYV